MAELPSKLYYTISEVSELTGIKPHVLRYWETEFPSLRPRKGRAGSRRYRQPDIDQIQTIARLLYEQGFKIAGARKHLQQQRRQTADTAAPKQLSMAFNEMEIHEQLAFVRKELAEVRDLVRELGPPENERATSQRAKA